MRVFLRPQSGFLTGETEMAKGTVAGTKIGISASLPVTHDVTGFVALTYTNIGEIIDGGEHGRTYAEVTSNPIDTRATQKYKGSFNEGTKTLQLDMDNQDAGQIALKAALNSDNDYAFEVEYPNGDIDYFLAKVMSFSKATGNVDSMRSATVTLSITTDKNGVGIVEFLTT
jgi:hypothetical protein